jgi:hypothetical protein
MIWYNIIFISIAFPLMSIPKIKLGRPAAAQDSFDTVAIMASGLCLAHCLLLPVLMFILPVLAAWFAVPESVHLWGLALAAPIRSLALYLGQKRHRRWTPICIALPGLVSLAMGASTFPGLLLESILSICGAIGLTVAHLLNGQYTNVRVNNFKPDLLIVVEK